MWWLWRGLQLLQIIPCEPLKCDVKITWCHSHTTKLLCAAGLLDMWCLSQRSERHSTSWLFSQDIFQDMGMCHLCQVSFVSRNIHWAGGWLCLGPRLLKHGLWESSWQEVPVTRLGKNQHSGHGLQEQLSYSKAGDQQPELPHIHRNPRNSPASLTLQTLPGGSSTFQSMVQLSFP